MATRPSVVARESLVIGLCVLLAFPVGVVGDQYTAAPTWFGTAAFLLVGVGLPQAVTDALDRR